MRQTLATAIPETSPSLPVIPAHDVAPRYGHTERDFAELVAAGVDPQITQGREHAVRCAMCDRRTFHQEGRCDVHYIAPHAARRALARAGAQT